jgi:hypothetical protein
MGLSQLVVLTSAAAMVVSCGLSVSGEAPAVADGSVDVNGGSSSGRADAHDRGDGRSDGPASDAQVDSAQDVSGFDTGLEDAWVNTDSGCTGAADCLPGQACQPNGTCSASCAGGLACNSACCDNTGVCQTTSGTYCGAAGGPCSYDCDDAAAGTSCVNGACGCSGASDCSQSPNGPSCMDGGCGCMHGGDCSNSPNGNQCLRTTGICGCTNDGNCPGGNNCCTSTAGCFGGGSSFTPYQQCEPQ